MNLLLTRMDGEPIFINWDNVYSAQPTSDNNTNITPLGDHFQMRYSTIVKETLEDIQEMLDRGKPENEFCNGYVNALFDCDVINEDKINTKVKE